ncbi:uncharacterized protein LOC111613518 [Centruroides sculpturatus]|uniref:uncharacterized protein LOC111613518 n=1 Tax=Centruroides sculpturatus TaxID=218467 RepID=UPI000C6E518B|nr:uncharacterized protein LOC111613518 [Centruroides sculpturatus]
MATFGCLEEFDPTHPSQWISYAERLDAYLTANNIEDEERKKAILLTACGRETYNLLRSLLSPNLPTTKSFQELKDVLRSHFAPQPSRIVRRNQFYRRDQKVEESLSVYIAELRRLAEFCEFGPHLEEMLCDRLVCGLLDETLQRRLFARKNYRF